MKDSRKKFNRIYDEYVSKIYRFVYIKVSSKETAEDLTSQTFIKGWQAIESGTDIKNPKAFIYQIARNLVVDFYREKAKHLVIPEEFIGAVPDETADIQKKAEIKADLDKTLQILSGLREEYKDIIIWHYLDDLSVKEIAKMLTKPENNVRVTLHRALSSLREEANKLGTGN